MFNNNTDESKKDTTSSKSTTDKDSTTTKTTKESSQKELDDLFKKHAENKKSQRPKSYATTSADKSFNSTSKSISVTNPIQLTNPNITKEPIVLLNKKDNATRSLLNTFDKSVSEPSNSLFDNNINYQNNDKSNKTTIQRLNNDLFNNIKATDQSSRSLFNTNEKAVLYATNIPNLENDLDTFIDKNNFRNNDVLNDYAQIYNGDQSTVKTVRREEVQRPLVIEPVKNIGIDPVAQALQILMQKMDTMAKDQLSNKEEVLKHNEQVLLAVTQKNTELKAEIATTIDTKVTASQDSC
jgi:hypothetical protein